MKILFTLCGRAGSKGFKNKNIKELNGVPLVFYSIAVIRQYKEKHPEDTVLVALNTDSKELISTVKKQILLTDIIFVPRKKNLSEDTVAKVDVIRNTWQILSDNENFDAVVDLDITSPMRRLCDVENVIHEFQLNDGYDLVFSVVEARRSPYFNMVEEKASGFYGKICQSSYMARQQAPKSYELNASIYAYRPAFLQSEITEPILDYKCGISVMPDYLVLDIDSEEDFIMMGYLHHFYCQKDKELEYIYQMAAAGKERKIGRAHV